MKILLAGDSTVTNCPAAAIPMWGWGAQLGAPLNARRTQPLRAPGHLDRSGPPVVVGVLNVAKGGATTASHRAAHLWDALLLAAEPGDGVVIQFGDNDAKVAELAARGGYRANLEGFLDDVERAGCCPVIDPTTLTAALHEDLGADASAALFVHLAPGTHPLYPEGIADDTHDSWYGASRAADPVASELAPLVAARLGGAAA